MKWNFGKMTLINIDIQSSEEACYQGRCAARDFLNIKSVVLTRHPFYPNSSENTITLLHMVSAWGEKRSSVLSTEN